MDKLQLLILASVSLSDSEKKALIKMVPDFDEQARNQLIETFEREKENLNQVYAFNKGKNSLIENMVVASTKAYKKRERLGIAEIERLIISDEQKNSDKLLDEI